MRVKVFMSSKLEDPRGNVCFPLYKRFLSILNAVTLTFILLLMGMGIYWVGGHYLKPIDGSSMQPGINNYENPTGDIAVVNRYDTIERGDIVILDTSCSSDTQINDKLLIKRVIALPGDMLRMRNENGIINVYIKKAGESEFTLLDESSYISSNSNSFEANQKLRNFQNQSPWRDWKGGDTYGIIERIDFDTILIPDGYIFFMGDNRADSYDSRCVGPQPVSSVIGVVESILEKDSFWNNLIEFLF